MTAIALLALTLIIVTCAWGMFSHAFQDNMWQRLGMVTTLLGCMSMMHFMYRLEYIHPGALTTLVGVSLFAVGTAVRSYNHRRKTKYGRYFY